MSTGLAIVENVGADAQSVKGYHVDNLKRKTATIELTHLKPNHQVFEWDVVNGMIRPAEVAEQVVLVNSLGKKSDYKPYIEFYVKDNCHYAPALNAQNAEKRFKRRFGIK